MSPTSTENARLIRSGYDALNAGDLSAMLALLDDSSVLHFRSAGGSEEVLHGADELAALYRTLLGTCDVVRVSCRSVDGELDSVHVQGTLTIRLRGTGRFTQSSFRHSYRMRRGVVVAGVFEDPIDSFALVQTAASGSGA